MDLSQLITFFKIFYRKILVSESHTPSYVQDRLVYVKCNDNLCVCDNTCMHDRITCIYVRQYLFECLYRTCFWHP